MGELNESVEVKKEIYADLKEQNITSLISLPITFLALSDLITQKKDRIVSQKLLETFIEHHSDYDSRTTETETAAVIVTDIIREKLGFPPRKFLSLSGKIALQKKIVEQNRILEGK